MSSSGTRVKGYRTRKPLRAALLAVILSGTAGLVWFNVLHPHQSPVSCPSSSDNGATATVSERLPASGLDSVPPAAPESARVRVLNAGGMFGKATIVNGELAQLGFATAAPANDPRYPAFDLRCYGEIRFGAEGQAAARTLSLAVPCAEFVRDDRPDATVDLALGTRFIALTPNRAARRVLLDLAETGRPALRESSDRGGLAVPVRSRSAPGAPVPRVSGQLLRQARRVTC